MLFRTDGISLSITYCLPYKTNLYNNPRVKTKKLRILPAEETEQCKKVVGFCKFARDTYMNLLKREPDYCTSHNSSQKCLARDCLAIARSPTNTSSGTLHARRHAGYSVLGFRI